MFCSRLLVCVLGALFLCSCAPQANVPHVDEASADAEAKYQQTLVLRDSVDKLDLLARVAWNIRARNAELCGDVVTRGTGLTLLELDDYAKQRRDIAREVLGLTSSPTVFQAPPGSPAEQAGLKRGDIVRLVGGVKPENKKQARELIDAAVKKGEDVPMEVERAGERFALVVKPVSLCDYPIALDQSEVVNAYADGSKIIVNKGMLKFVKSDDELAGILGHEMAHNTRKHIRDMQVNSTLGRLLIDLPVAVFTGVNPNLGWQLGRAMYSQDYEYEADYVGLYYTARAGYDTRVVPEIWRRMALDNPKGITMGTTHPSTSRRYVALDAGVAEINAKRDAGQPLRPEIKGETQPAAPQQAGVQTPPAQPKAEPQAPQEITIPEAIPQ